MLKVTGHIEIRSLSLHTFYLSLGKKIEKKWRGRLPLLSFIVIFIISPPSLELELRGAELGLVNSSPNWLLEIENVWRWLGRGGIVLFLYSIILKREELKKWIHILAISRKVGFYKIVLPL